MKAAGINVANSSHIAQALLPHLKQVCALYRQIMSAAGWTSATTFARFYNKPIDVDNGFADNILSLD